jgi:hypothetical protein
MTSAEKLVRDIWTIWRQLGGVQGLDPGISACPQGDGDALLISANGCWVRIDGKVFRGNDRVAVERVCAALDFLYPQEACS